MSESFQSYLRGGSWSGSTRRAMPERYCERQSQCICVRDREEPQRLRYVSIYRGHFPMRSPSPTPVTYFLLTVCSRGRRPNGRSKSNCCLGTCGLSRPRNSRTSSSASCWARSATTNSVRNASTAQCASLNVGSPLDPYVRCPVSWRGVRLANGISIPSSYTAYLAPLSSSKLYNEVHAGKDDKASETPYVVMFQAVNILSGQGGGNGGRCGTPIQECWEFEHPRRDVVLDERGRSHR